MTSLDLPTGTVTFLFSDIEGSTRLVAELGPAAYRDLLELHQTLLRAAFAANEGIERGTQGDSFTVVFRDAGAAIAAAVAAQRAIATADWPNGRAIRVRMGVHTGSAIAGGDDYVGIDINRAARIMSAGHGGQVLLSDATRSLVDGALPEGVALRELGEHRLKDLTRPERVHQLVIEGLPSAFPPLKAESSELRTIPPRLTSFVGRDRELRELGSLMDATRLLTLTGPGGTGKTSLSVELARGLAERFTDGIAIVALETVTDPDLVAPTIATRIGLVEAPGRSARDLLVEFLKDRSMLLVLDNFEQVLGAAPFVAELLHAASRLAVVVTSRAPLHLSGEQEFPVPPLALPDPTTPAAAALRSPAVELFVERAARVMPGFRLTDEDAAAVVDICRRLDGLPLGIELAASRVGLLGPREIARRLAARLDLPGPAPRDLPSRQRTLGAAIEWSVELLDERSRTLLGRLAVFAGGWQLPEAEALCGEVDPDAVIDDLSTLVDHSLVQPQASPDGPRYRLLETIRMLAASRLATSGEEPAIRRRHAETYAALADEAATRMTRRGQADVIVRLDAEHDNLRAALAWAIANGEAELAMRLAGALWRFWQVSGHVQEGSAWLDAVLAMPGADRPTRARVVALGAAGSLAWWQSDVGRADALYRTQVSLARELDDPQGLADALFNLAHSTRAIGQADATAALVAEALAIYERLGDEVSAARVRSVGAFSLLPGDPTAAAAELERFASLFDALGDDFYGSLANGTLAWIAVAQGDVERVIRYALKGLDQSYALGDLATMTLGLHDGAAFLMAMGDLEGAATVEAAFERLSRRHGIRPPTGMLIGPDTELGTALALLLTDPALARARAHGEAMSLEDAVEYGFDRLRTQAGTPSAA